MIHELKKKKTKIGTIIASHVEGYNTPEEAANLEAMNAVSAFVTIHTLSGIKSLNDGVAYITQKTGPKLKMAIGHHIAQIRPEHTVAFVMPNVKFLEDVSKVYNFADTNRMERSYGFFLGDPDNPDVVAFTGAIIPHIFHSVPDQLDMVGREWIQWLHSWAPKAMMKHRYFNANEFCAIAVPVIVDKSAEAYPIVDAPFDEVIVAPEPVKKKAGRPKKK